MKDLLAWHRERFGLMQDEDAVKLIFQAMQGCGHLLGPEEAVEMRIIDEEAVLLPDPKEALFDPLGKAYVRLNLRRAMAEGIAPRHIARMMKITCDRLTPASREDVVRAVAALKEPGLASAAQRLLDEPQWLPSHSQQYHAAYSPAYRVVSSALTPLLPLLCACVKLDSQRLSVICIDGPCGSGKSTLAALLQRITGAALVSMDDFFLPHGRKTPDRLAQPGGNADWERVIHEVLEPAAAAGRIEYRPYNCHTDRYDPPVVLKPKRLLILEGSYSLLPQISRFADLRVFLTVDEASQLERIRNRDGDDYLPVFQSRWIPLERAYHAAYGLPDKDCLVIDTSCVQAM